MNVLWRRFYAFFEYVVIKQHTVYLSKQLLSYEIRELKIIITPYNIQYYIFNIISLIGHQSLLFQFEAGIFFKPLMGFSWTAGERPWNTSDIERSRRDPNISNTLPSQIINLT